MQRHLLLLTAAAVLLVGGIADYVLGSGSAGLVAIVLAAAMTGIAWQDRVESPPRLHRQAGRRR